MRSTGLAVGFALTLVLTGCLGSPAPSTETSTDVPTTKTSADAPTTQTTPTTQTCTMTGGYLIAAEPIDPATATDGEVVAYENLSTGHQDAFDRMLDGDYQGHPRTPEGFPAYVRYNGTLYEPQEAGNWDQFC